MWSDVERYRISTFFHSSPTRNSRCSLSILIFFSTFPCIFLLWFLTSPRVGHVVLIDEYITSKKQSLGHIIQICLFISNCLRNNSSSSKINMLSRVLSCACSIKTVMWHLRDRTVDCCSSKLRNCHTTENYHNYYWKLHNFCRCNNCDWDGVIAQHILSTALSSSLLVPIFSLSIPRTFRMQINRAEIVIYVVQHKIFTNRLLTFFSFHFVSSIFSSRTEWPLTWPIHPLARSKIVSSNAIPIPEVHILIIIEDDNLDSDASTEWTQTAHKAETVVSAIGAFQTDLSERQRRSEKNVKKNDRK